MGSPLDVQSNRRRYFPPSTARHHELGCTSPSGDTEMVQQCEVYNSKLSVLVSKHAFQRSSQENPVVIRPISYLQMSALVLQS